METHEESLDSVERTIIRAIIACQHEDPDLAQSLTVDLEKYRKHYKVLS